MGSLFRILIRQSAFLGKEIVEILRQPRLVLTLVLGPFLILLLFGIGFRNQARPLRTVFVIEPGSALGQYVQEYATNLGPQLLFMGIEADEAVAKERLRRGEVDLVAVAPPNAYETIQNNQKAEFLLYHNELDPFQVDYIRVFGRVYVDEVNRRILETITAKGQGEAADIQELLNNGRTSSAAIRQALETGDQEAANVHAAELGSNLNSVAVVVGATAGLLGGVRDTLGGAQNDNVQQVLDTLTGLQASVNELSASPGSTANTETQIQQLAEIETEINTLESLSAEFRQIQPAVLVSPFSSNVQSIAPETIEVSAYFAPGVVALLLQHLAVTIAALSFVRDRQLGAVELFRVAPVTAGEILFGKYLSFLLFGALLSSVLITLLIYALNVPMLGSWVDLAVVLLALLFASIGLGFVISLLSQTDSQAVQFAMIILLTSVFFSGFFLHLQLFWEPVRVIAWLLPVTYGIQLLQNVMLRGQPLDLLTLGSLLAMGLLLTVIAWLLTRRLMNRP